MQANSDYLLIETIRQVGVSNYSLIARLTGLNPETVRYKINKQLSRLGLEVLISIDYGKLGFSMSLLSVTPNANGGRAWLDHANYLIFASKAMTLDRYLCITAVPYRYKKKYADTIAEMQTLHLIDEYEFLPVSWVRYPPLRSEFFDLESGQWKVDWNKVDNSQNEIGTTSKMVDTEARIDQIDAKILRYMQEEPTVSPARVAKLIGANARTVRYHYSEHVMKGGLVLCNNVRWSDRNHQGKGTQTMQIALVFTRIPAEETTNVRKLCNKIPFTVLEASLEERGHFAYLDVPMEHFHDTVNYIERNTASATYQHQMFILDSSKTQFLNIPEELFDKERGWRLVPTLSQPPVANSEPQKTYES
jgi:hypothetical protein